MDYGFCTNKEVAEKWIYGSISYYDYKSSRFSFKECKEMLINTMQKCCENDLFCYDDFSDEIKAEHSKKQIKEYYAEKIKEIKSLKPCECVYQDCFGANTFEIFKHND